MSDFNPTIPTKKQKPFKGNNEATVSKGIKAPSDVNPQATSPKAYLKTQKKFTGGNSATVGKVSNSTVSKHQAIDPSKTLPSAYTKKQSKAK